MGWHLTGEDEVVGADSPVSPDHRPTVSHNLDPQVCTRCGDNPRYAESVWCRGCIQAGRGVAKASIMRQIGAGMSVPHQNWKPGDPFWWKASGCYGD